MHIHSPSKAAIIAYLSDSEYRALSTCKYCHYPYMLDLTLRPITYLHKKELGVDTFKQDMVIKLLNRLAPRYNLVTRSWSSL